MFVAFQRRAVVVGARAGGSSITGMPLPQPPPMTPQHLLSAAGYSYFEPVSCQYRFMAGHNKWSKIRHKKGANDRARASLFGKAARAIAAASKDCQGDRSNIRLQSAIQHAKSIQLPKDRIEDAIHKGTSKKNSDGDLINLRFDAMMNCNGQKVACVITALSDNRNRATQHVRTMVSKAGGEFLNTDKLSYLFTQVGLILVESVDDEDALMMSALDAGAVNIEEEEEGTFTVTTEEKDLWQVVTALQQDGYSLSQFEHRYVLQEGNEPVDLTSDGIQHLEDFLEKLDEDEDVENVYHNAKLID